MFGLPGRNSAPYVCIPLTINYTVILTLKEKAPACVYTPLASRLGMKLALRDLGQAQRLAGLLGQEIFFENAYLGRF